jgi:Nitrile hydratase beta subunit
VLDFHKIINTEEKRRGVEALGSELVACLSYYERWIVAFAKILFEKPILTPEQLALKMDEVAARYRQSPAAHG